ncbi:hypothetical protein KIN20_019070 [Parelaphostrongylus tenuis]|uniref:Uncharacterized protein n=1 Tax=Parelaphostrongylus tenuis TaxID=148309 RepID=A0AAD5N2P9_PARTN|nr:hypothetical protein KIN20_019070 [Parelaphostrongylus tenuis]
MLCQAVILNLAADRVDDKKPQNCIIVSNTVTRICTKMMGAAGPMPCDTAIPSAIAAIPGTHLTISGTLSTTKIIMANWSRTMWQSVVNRAVRMLAARPFGSHFFSAVVIVSGN